MRYFESTVYKELCKRLFNNNVLQFGMISGNEMKYIMDYIIKYQYREILDCGCGCGGIDYCLTQNITNINITAIDADKEAVKFAKKVYGNKNIKYWVKNFDYIDNFMEKKFQVIMFLDTIYFSLDYIKLLDDCLTLLENNGILIITYTSYNSLENNAILNWIAQNKCAYHVMDNTDELKRFWSERKELLTELENDFKLEGSFDLFSELNIESKKFKEDNIYFKREVYVVQKFV